MNKLLHYSIPLNHLLLDLVAPMILCATCIESIRKFCFSRKVMDHFCVVHQLLWKKDARFRYLLLQLCVSSLPNQWQWEEHSLFYSCVGCDLETKYKIMYSNFGFIGSTLQFNERLVKTKS